ncbi:hypothetical protein BN59_00487 [Legionella massiliensis]|uniref:Glycosyltransferase 2-like domain-containing protein n=1 Tax=Legionella massiliensis TaxID=1034943 RepID=A0A078KP98_9GAMM|nr:glycosyltransferase family 2 protein [Legionella massiliensis]CDZ76220.1 hypothetical protein BN59_00487 [Legionella massiliensis]CEE11958.1 hypothetical protein BN1094_00487 [Legionella massiliensis]
MKTITIVTPCFNEEVNVDDIYTQVKNVFAQLPQYQYKHLFIDNSSNDSTVALIKKLIEKDKNVQLIVNNRNFGHVRSPYYGLLQAQGDAAILIAADLQEPPELIVDFIRKWEAGAQVVVGVKNQSKESKIFFAIRKFYYMLVTKIAEVELIKNYTGFGLYDKEVLKVLRELNDPYPYFRGLIPELGFKTDRVFYIQPQRKRGFSKNNFYALYDMAMLGFTSNSKVPMRLAALLGFSLAALSLFVSFFYLVLKLVFWNSFSMGVAPVVVGLFFFFSMQLFFLGVLGEYVNQILVQVRKRPLVLENERINLDG